MSDKFAILTLSLYLSREVLEEEARGGSKLRTVIHMEEAVPQSDLHLDMQFDRCASAPEPLQTVIIFYYIYYKYMSKPPFKTILWSATY